MTLFRVRFDLLVETNMARSLVQMAMPGSGKRTDPNTNPGHSVSFIDIVEIDCVSRFV